MLSFQSFDCSVFGTDKVLNECPPGLSSAQLVQEDQTFGADRNHHHRALAAGVGGGEPVGRGGFAGHSF